MAQYDARQFAQEIVEIMNTTPKEELGKLTIDEIMKLAQKKIESKNPVSLEVTVNDAVKVMDKLMDAIAHIVKAIQDWMFSNHKEPLVISVKKVEARGPPALGISVGESSRIRTGLV